MSQASLAGSKDAPVERRKSERWFAGKEISWQVHRGRRVHVGRVAERSLHGLVILTQAGDLPPPGTCVKPADSSTSVRHGFRSGVVRRIRHARDGESQVVVEILS